MRSEESQQNELGSTTQAQQLELMDDLITDSSGQDSHHLINRTKKVQEIEEKSNFWVSVPIIKSKWRVSYKCLPSLSYIKHVDLLFKSKTATDILGRTCFKDIGCFSATEYQDIKRRPLPLLPMAPELIQTTFHIFSPKDQLIAQNFSYNATSDELKDSLFDPQLNSIFITHGFRSGFEPWIKVRSHIIDCFSLHLWSKS